MKKWGLSVSALTVLAGLFAFGVLHNTPNTNTPNQNYLKPAPSKTKVQTPTPSEPPSNVQDKKLETKQITLNQPIPFANVSENDPTLPKGITKVSAQGVNGVKQITYKVTYVDGLETAREKLSEVVSTAPVEQVTKVGTREAAVHSMDNSPAGATALCADGNLSYAQEHQWACLRHGGVSIWYR
jgi:hypothetical protein